MKKDPRRQSIRRRKWKRWLRYQYVRVVRLNDSPEKIAAGLALGVVLGILPTFGLGIIIAVFTAGLFRVNRVSAVIGTFIMNPWTATFFWAASYIIGSLTIGQNLPETLQLIKTVKSHGDLWRSLLEQRLLLPYVVGNIMITAGSAALSYVACLYIVRAYRHARKERLERKAESIRGGRNPRTGPPAGP